MGRGEKKEKDSHRVNAPDKRHTCPMHPEVIREGPGICPKCGMALEPLVPVTATAGHEFVCPMHPDVVRSEPGTCPKCGMALEARTAAPEDQGERAEGCGSGRRSVSLWWSLWLS